MTGASTYSPDLNADRPASSPDTRNGLESRQGFMEKVETLIADRSDDPVPFCLCLIGMDGFKPVNDLFGRAAGDEIIRQVALRLRASLPEGATLARFNGDKFALLYPLIFTEKSARENGQLLLDTISIPYELEGRMARLTASMGGALYYDGSENGELVLEKAEIALRHAKSSGRSAIVIYNQRMEDDARRRVLIEQALRRAVSAGEIEPFFQPIVNLFSGKVIGFECLARWRDRELGLVPPSVFIPIAEQRGIMGPLSQMLLTKATQSAVAWPDHIFLSFNLSPVQMVNSNTVLRIITTLEKTGFDARRLDIEITENGVMSDPAAARDVVASLRKIGASISLDDFGTGQSSLARLRDLEFDKLKIDRTFISEILHDSTSEHIVRAILAMCEGLEVDVVAEGIEEQAQAVKLIELGCTYGQGYLYGKAANAQETRSFLDEGACTKTHVIFS